MRPGFQGCFVRILCVAALWFGVSASGIGAVTISSPVSSSSIATGQSFVATLSLDTFAGVEAVDVGFVFDAALLSLEAVDLAPGVPEPFAPLQFEPGVGQKKVGFLYLSPVSAGPGPIAILLATFKALGATRQRIAAMFSAEFLILGTVAGLMGSLLATAFTWLVLKRFFEETPFRVDFAAVGVSILLTAVIAAISGWLAIFRVLEQKPLEVLRGE